MIQISAAYSYDPNDFAVEVVEYIEGTGVGNDAISGEPFNEPNSALGRPTLETTGDGTSIDPNINVPVVPVYPAFRYFEVVTIGDGNGSITLKFNHRVSNDDNNLYGIDFIIFGNAKLSGGGFWTNGNPEDVTVSSAVFNEPGIVSVSQNGTDWYTFDTGPYADDFAPTAGYRWDAVNDVWADELDPTRPIEPNLSASDVDGYTVAEVIDSYDGSAGGTGFDLEELEPNDFNSLSVDPNSNRRWIQYVRIEDKPGSAAKTEVDAVADVSACGDYKHPYPEGDVNKNCVVDFGDIAIITRSWLDCSWNCQ